VKRTLVSLCEGVPRGSVLEVGGDGRQLRNSVLWTFQVGVVTRLGLGAGRCGDVLSASSSLPSSSSSSSSPPPAVTSTVICRTRNAGTSAGRARSNSASARSSRDARLNVGRQLHQWGIRTGIFRFVIQSRYGGHRLCRTVGSVYRVDISRAFCRVSFLSSAFIVARVACSHCVLLRISSALTLCSRSVYISFVSRCSFHDPFLFFFHAVFGARSLKNPCGLCGHVAANGKRGHLERSCPSSDFVCHLSQCP